MKESRQQRLIRRLKLVLELYDEDEYVTEVAGEALKYVQSVPDSENEEDDGK